METLTVQFIKDHVEAKLPYKKYESDACSDVYSVEDRVVEVGKVGIIDTGLKVAYIPAGYKIEAYDRSGFGAKAILVSNSPGQIDETYRGNLKILLLNLSEETLVIKIGDRIAQIALEEVIPVKYEFTDVTTSTERGEGGFGSTGVR